MEPEGSDSVWPKHSQGGGTKIALLDVLAEVKDSAATVQHEFAVKSVGVADVTDDSSVAAAFGEVSRTLGSPSILDQRRRDHRLGRQHRCLKESWQRVDINLTGTFLCCQALARACTAADTEGVIVNVSSMSARVVNLPQHQASYHASKAGVEMLTKALAVEWAPIDPRQRHRARLHAVRDDAVHDRQSGARRAVAEHDSGWTNGRAC